MVALTVLFLWIGRLVGGEVGMVLALGFAVLLNFGSYWYSDKLVLSMTRAQPTTPDQAPDLHAMVERLAHRAGIPKPKVYVVNDPSPNAFATGRNPDHAAVAVNTGLLHILDQPEVEGVLAHEMAHVKHRDTLTMAIVASLAGAIMVLANFARFAAIFGGGRDDGEGGNPLVLLLVSIFAPIAAMMVQMGVSRAREYEADRLGAELAGSPHGLANALAKLEKSVQTIPDTHAAPQMAHMYIIHPFGMLGGIANLFRTHPPTQDRIRRLLAMAPSGRMATIA